jgi:hypothetical protein
VGWRLTEETVDEKVKELSELLESTDENRTKVVYQLFGNMSFMVKKPDTETPTGKRTRQKASCGRQAGHSQPRGSEEIGEQVHSFAEG